MLQNLDATMEQISGEEEVEMQGRIAGLLKKKKKNKNKKLSIIFRHQAELCQSVIQTQLKTVV